MGDRTNEGMRRYWDDRAHENAVFYVDTTTDYEHPDMKRFLETGQGIAAEALTAAPVKPVGHDLAVEIGPGLGRVCLAMAEHFEQVIGIDVSAEMVRRARELVNDPRVTFEVGDGVSLAPVADATADFVYEFTVFQHIPKISVIEAYIAEAGRVLRPGGVAALQWNNQASPLWWKLRRMGATTLRAIGISRWADARFARQFLGTTVPTRRMAAALERNGLDVVGTKGEGDLFAWIWARKR
jgi:SAM-dependent methyltransferase